MPPNSVSEVYIMGCVFFFIALCLHVAQGFCFCKRQILHIYMYMHVCVCMILQRWDHTVLKPFFTESCIMNIFF